MCHSTVPAPCSSERNTLFLQLFDLGLLDRETTTEVVLSDFAGDASELSQSAAVAEIKNAAAAGHTVLLTNAAPIASSIFDLLNKHYTS
jgi:hypothetical protein